MADMEQQNESCTPEGEALESAINDYNELFAETIQYDADFLEYYAHSYPDEAKALVDLIKDTQAQTSDPETDPTMSDFFRSDELFSALEALDQELLTYELSVLPQRETSEQNVPSEAMREDLSALNLSDQEFSQILDLVIDKDVAYGPLYNNSDLTLPGSTSSIELDKEIAKDIKSGFSEGGDFSSTKLSDRTKKAFESANTNSIRWHKQAYDFLALKGKHFIQEKAKQKEATAKKEAEVAESNTIGSRVKRLLAAQTLPMGTEKKVTEISPSKSRTITQFDENGVEIGEKTIYSGGQANIELTNTNLPGVHIQLNYEDNDVVYFEKEPGNKFGSLTEGALEEACENVDLMFKALNFVKTNNLTSPKENPFDVEAFGMLKFDMGSSVQHFNVGEFDGHYVEGDPKAFEEMINEQYKNMLNPPAPKTEAPKQASSEVTIESIEEEWLNVIKEDLIDIAETDPDRAKAFQEAYAKLRQSDQPASLKALCETIHMVWAGMFPDRAPSSPGSLKKSTDTPARPQVARDYAPEQAQKTFRERLAVNREKTGDEVDTGMPRAEISPTDTGHRVSIHLPDVQDVRNSRITDFVGKEGALLNLSEEELAKTALRLEADDHGQKAGVEYTWKDGTWKNPAGERLKVYDGTQLYVGPKGASDVLGDATEWFVETPDGVYVVQKGPLDPSTLSIESETLGINAKGRLPDRFERDGVTYKLNTAPDGTKSYLAEDGTKLVLEKGQSFKVFYDEAPVPTPAPEAPVESLKTVGDAINEKSTKATLKALTELAEFGYKNIPIGATRPWDKLVAKGFTDRFGTQAVRLDGLSVKDGRLSLTYSVKKTDGSLASYKWDKAGTTVADNGNEKGGREVINVSMPTLSVDKKNVEDKSLVVELHDNAPNRQAIQSFMKKWTDTKELGTPVTA